MGMTQKSEVRFRKIAMSLESEVVQKLDTYAEKKFKGNRSAAANYLLVHARRNEHNPNLLEALLDIYFRSRVGRRIQGSSYV